MTVLWLLVRRTFMVKKSGLRRNFWLFPCLTTLTKMNLDWLPFCRTSGRRRTDVRASHSDPSITHQALLVWQCALNSLRMHFCYNVVYWNNSVCCCACFYWYLSARTALWRCSNSCSTRTFQCRVVLALVLGTEALVVAVEQRIQQIRHIGARSRVVRLWVEFGV